MSNLSNRIKQLEEKQGGQPITVLGYDVYARALEVAREIFNAPDLNNAGDTDWLKAEAANYTGQANNIYKTILDRINTKGAP